ILKGGPDLVQGAGKVVAGQVFRVLQGLDEDAAGRGRVGAIAAQGDGDPSPHFDGERGKEPDEGVVGLWITAGGQGLEEANDRVPPSGVLFALPTFSGG